MQKLSSFTGQARQSWDRMTPNFGGSNANSHANTNANANLHAHANANGNGHPAPPGPPHPQHGQHPTNYPPPPPLPHLHQHPPHYPSIPPGMLPRGHGPPPPPFSIPPPRHAASNGTPISGPPPGKRSVTGPASHGAAAAMAANGNPPPSSLSATESAVNISFNIPFASNLPGPDADAVLHASPGALDRWVQANNDDDADSPTHKLPVHVRNVEHLRQLCNSLCDASGGRLEAAVTCAEPKPSSAAQRSPRKGPVTNVCLSGDADLVHSTRARILKELPIALKCAIVDIDTEFVVDGTLNGIKPGVIEHLDTISKFTGSDIFLLNSKQVDSDRLTASCVNGSDQTLEQRLRIAVYGDPESSEHAKMRVLIMIDQILKRTVDIMRLELSLHSVICGRTRKNIRHIEAVSRTAIYFPPPFPRIYGYLPPGAHRRGEDELFITGESQDNINQAKARLHELVMNTKCFVKEVTVLPHKIDCILLDRLDKVRRVMEVNGTYVLFPALGSQRSAVRVQGTDVLHVERTVREIMALAGQFYSASWWIIQPDPAQANSRPPSGSDIRAVLSDICTNSGAEVSFERFSFTIHGSDDALKAAMVVIHQIPFVNRAQYQMRVKIELANEHKEFVSGKKNGKINKIMGQSNVQIIFDGFNEYNFHIDVCANQYEATRSGLELVEQEMPASISFHVPDQYHKRIIGIGGQHIQRIMKKYSVFVKFSNAMDRGGLGKDDEDVKVDNVICRTPARNAQSLDLVKQEIMDMVEKARNNLADNFKDAELVSENVIINRLYHRELIARMAQLDELERKWNCKLEFPSTEQASDIVTISGPEYQVPQALDEFLGMVPEEHEIIFPGNPALRAFYRAEQFETEVRNKLQAQYEVTLTIRDDAAPLNPAEPDGLTEERAVLAYTRNNAGGLKDAIDFLVSCLVPYGLDASTVKGAIPRPKSDSFEDSLPFFDSKLLSIAPTPVPSTPVGTDSPTRASFAASTASSNSGTPLKAPTPINAATSRTVNDDTGERNSLFAKLRKPGSIPSISSFLDRRKNHANANIGPPVSGKTPQVARHHQTPSSSSSLFKHASSNASRASLVSMESRDSGYSAYSGHFYRGGNPWNDSGANLSAVTLPTTFGGSSGSSGGSHGMNCLGDLHENGVATSYHPHHHNASLPNASILNAAMPNTSLVSLSISSGGVPHGSISNGSMSNGAMSHAVGAGGWPVRFDRKSSFSSIASTPLTTPLLPPPHLGTALSNGLAALNVNASPSGSGKGNGNGTGSLGNTNGAPLGQGPSTAEGLDMTSNTPVPGVSGMGDSTPLPRTPSLESNVGAIGSGIPPSSNGAIGSLSGSGGAMGPVSGQNGPWSHRPPTGHSSLNGFPAPIGTPR